MAPPNKERELTAKSIALFGKKMAKFAPLISAAHLKRYVRPHVTAHLGMLRIGWRRRHLREIFGQLLRIPGGDDRIRYRSRTAWQYRGSRISAFRSLPVPKDLKDLLVLDRRSRLN